MKPLFCPALAVAALSLAAGCAHQTAEQRHLDQIQDEISHVQADHDRFDQRLNALEIDAAEDKRPLPRSPTTSAPTPRQRVIRVSPDGSEQVQASSETAGALNGEDPDDTTPRPTIRVSGERGTHKGRGSDHVEETLPDDPANGGTLGPPIRSGAPQASALDAEARRSYDAALALVNAHQFDKALDAFAAFLVKWPDHPNADNAMYWRGECYFAQGEFARAAEQFEGTIARFPLGNKVPDALLKLGMCQQKLGNPARAKTYFERLTRDFPRSEAARRIPQERDGAPRSAGPRETP